MTPAIDIAGLTAGYGGAPVLRDLTVSVPEGEIAAVLGPNGAGKTTLLRCITGRCRASAGAVRLFGSPAARLSAPQRARTVAVVPQEVETPMAFTVEEIVTIGRSAALSRWRPPAKRDRAIVAQSMNSADVYAMRGRPYAELSGGEKQRVVIAMALAQQPRIILLDEATSHLDMNHRLDIMELIARLNREHKVTVVMVSHDINLAAAFCRRVVLLDGGRLAAQGLPSDVLTPDTLQAVYRCNVRVRTDPEDGSLTVTPARRTTQGA
ncbi:MAG: ABC transporter ATP-binding protein [Lentisphaerae bacterium]|nr:ABC transporter ATP-binding protein [Lentisphaerota bacterium]